MEMPKFESNLRVATIQWDVYKNNPEKNLYKISYLIENYAKGKAELAILPEMCISGFINEHLPEEAQKINERLEALKNIAVKNNIWICLSLAEPIEQLNEINKNTSGLYCSSCLKLSLPKVYNTLYLIDKHGNVRLKYRKIHLFPLTSEPEYFEGGKEIPKPCDAGEWKIGCGICYDLRFPELFRIQAKWGANLFLVPSQFPKARHSAFRFLSQARGVDAQAYIISCNRIGIDGKLDFIGGSMICDYLGNIIVEDSNNESVSIATILASNVLDYRKKFPFLSNLPLLQV